MIFAAQAFIHLAHVRPQGWSKTSDEGHIQWHHTLGRFGKRRMHPDSWAGCIRCILITMQQIMPKV